MDTDSAVEAFARVRPRLLAIGYRMLGSVQEAEDLAQEAWLRWNDAGGRAPDDRESVRTPEAWLVTVTTRMAIDRLRALRTRRSDLSATWLPEPLIDDGPATPEQLLERADDVSFAFLVLLDVLAPTARAALLLRDVFDADYTQVSAALGRTEAAARQIVHRARQRVNEARSRERQPTRTPPALQVALLRRLIQAITDGDFAAIQAVLAEDATLTGDFGGASPSLRAPLRGGRRLAQLYLAHHLRNRHRMQLELARLNGGWAILRYLDGELDSVQAFGFDAGRILRVWVQRDPVKLARIRQQVNPLVRPDVHAAG